MGCGPPFGHLLQVLRKFGVGLLYSHTKDALSFCECTYITLILFHSSFSSAEILCVIPTFSNCPEVYLPSPFAFTGSFCFQFLFSSFFSWLTQISIYPYHTPSSLFESSKILLDFLVIIFSSHISHNKMHVALLLCGN